MRITSIIFLVLTSVNVAHSESASKPTVDQGIEEFSYDQVMAQENVESQENVRDTIIIQKIENEKYYVSLLSAMSILALLVSLMLLKNSSPTSKDIVVVTGLNFVVFGSIISILIVDTTEQLGAVTGILGALGGYLFGTWSKNEKE